MIDWILAICIIGGAVPDDCFIPPYEQSHASRAGVSREEYESHRYTIFEDKGECRKTRRKWNKVIGSRTENTEFVCMSPAIGKGRGVTIEKLKNQFAAIEPRVQFSREDDSITAKTLELMPDLTVAETTEIMGRKPNSTELRVCHSGGIIRENTNVTKENEGGAKESEVGTTRLDTFPCYVLKYSEGANHGLYIIFKRRTPTQWRIAQWHTYGEYGQ